MTELESCEYLVGRLAEICKAYDWLLAVHSGKDEMVDGVLLGEAELLARSIGNGWDIFDLKEMK